MSATGREDSVGAFERLTQTFVFSVLLGLSVAFALVTLMSGLLLLAMSLTFGLLLWLLVLGLIVGGIAGLAGLLFGRMHISWISQGRVEAAIVLLAAGVAAALVGVGIAVLAPFDAGLDRVAAAVLGVLFAAPQTVLIVAAVGTVQRLTRCYALRTGVPFDVLPIILLLTAFGLALAVLASALALP